MIHDADREDAIAAARRIPRNTTVQLPDAEPIIVTPGGKGGVAQATPNTQPAAPATAPAKQNSSAALQTASAANTQTKTAAIEELPSYVPAPKSLISDKAATELAAVNTSSAGTQELKTTRSSILFTRISVQRKSRP
jgi:hypothetical protein